MSGSVDTRLVILRGNSGSGKSTTAKRLRERLGRGVAWIEQDYLRRIVLREHDHPGAPNIGLIECTARYALDAGYHVIMEGIFYTRHYGEMLIRITDDHEGDTQHYYFDIPYEETVRRHATRPQIGEFTPAQMRDWYQGHDTLRLPGEVIIKPDQDVEAIVTMIIEQVGFPRPPALDRVAERDHLG